MKYVANPVQVKAMQIVSVATRKRDGALHVATDDGVNRVATEEMISRFRPRVGDYWVVQADGYEYLNPRDVFGRKYSIASAWWRAAWRAFRSDWRAFIGL